MAQLTCSACGATLPVGAMFCGECGRSVSPAALAPAQPAPLEPPPLGQRPSRRPIAPPPARSEPGLIAPPPAGGDDTRYPTGDLSALAEATGSIQTPEIIRTADTTDLSEALVDLPVAEARRAEDVPASRDAADSRNSVDSQPACEACGATMGAHDIFCGECGHVSGMVSRAFGRDAVAPASPAPERSAPSVVEGPERGSAHEGGAQDDGAHPDGAHDDGSDDDGSDDDIEATRIVAPTRAGQRYILQFSTGESVTAHGSGLVGRNPIPEPGEYFDQLVRVIDPTRSVSKTHLEFGQDAGSFWVRDRFSGNGSILREPDAPARRCEPGKRYPVLRGTRIDLGEQFVVVS